MSNDGVKDQNSRFTTFFFYLDARSLFNFPFSALIFSFPSGFYIQLSDQPSSRYYTHLFYYCKQARMLWNWPVTQASPSNKIIARKPCIQISPVHPCLRFIQLFLLLTPFMFTADGYYSWARVLNHEKLNADKARKAPTQLNLIRITVQYIYIYMQMGLH